MAQVDAPGRVPTPSKDARLRGQPRNRDRGATSWYTLASLIMDELRQRASERRQAPRGGRRPGDKPGLHPTVMVVDDQPALRRLMARYLSSYRFKVEEAADGLEALSRIRDTPPHLIVTDLRMPVLGGGALVERLGADEHTRHIPVLIYSSDRAGAQLAARLPRATFVEKPAASKEILDGIRRVLRSRAPLPDGR